LREQETTFLVGYYDSIKRKKWDGIDALNELKSLVKTSDLIEVGATLCEVRAINPATYLGSGKVLSLAEEIQKLNAQVVIFDGNLSPTQNRNLEELWKVKVLDRTSLILDIFALHAKSREGKMQVELAQYEYLLPRLVGAWTHLSKQRGGGVGLRGPGETQLEVDRRRVKEKISRIREEIKKMSCAREIQRRQRESVPMPTITLVGYTNAGKSTLFNKVAEGAQVVEDKLFATLDPKSKKMELPSGQEIILTDTVGFIRDLPHELVQAFHSTFEQVSLSSILVHVVDVSHPQYRHRIEIVNNVLHDLHLDAIPVIVVANKIDQISADNESSSHLIQLSALDGKGIEVLLNRIDCVLSQKQKSMRLFFPHPYGALLSNLYHYGCVLLSKNTHKGVEVHVSLPEKWQRIYAAYAIS